MTALDSIEMRMREHERCLAILGLQQASLENFSQDISDGWRKHLEELDDEEKQHLKKMESQGIDYLTITAEMARIRAEVRGEK